VRIFEILLFVFTLVNLVLLFPSKNSNRKVAFGFASLAGLSLIAHLLVEKTRWQMMPVIVFTLILVITI
jgi:hypothetical protein